MSKTIRYALHEMKTGLKTPSFYFVAALFLFYQGIIFSITISLRHHPLSPPGPLLTPFFGGPFWFWPMLILVVVELSHDAISKERADGVLTLLLASPLSPGKIILGKFIAILSLYSILWLFTTPLIIILALYLPPGESIEMFPLITGYTGAVLIGASGLAIGLFFSSITDDTRLSGMFTFVLLFLLVLLKILIHPSFGIISSPSIIKFSGYLNFLDYMAAFSRGEVKMVYVMTLLGIISIFLMGATLFIGKMQKKHLKWQLLDLGLVFLIFSILSFSFAWRNTSWNPMINHDVDQRLSSRIEMIKEPVKIYIFASPPSSVLHFHPIPQLEMYLNDIIKNSKLLSWEKISVTKPAFHEKNLARKFNLNLEKIRRDPSGLLEGVMVVASGDHYRIIPLSSLFTVKQSKNSLTFKGLRLESELAGALAFLMDPGGLLLCVDTGHGEKDVNNTGPEGLSKLLLSLKKTGWSIRKFSSLSSVIPSKCKTLFFPGPSQPFLPLEINSIETYLQNGGSMVVTTAEIGEFPESFKELIAKYGINITDNTIFDLRNSIGKSNGYFWGAVAKGKVKSKNWRIILEGPREITTEKGNTVYLSSSSSIKRIHFVKNRGELQKDGKSSAFIAVSNPDSASSRVAVLGFTIPFLNKTLDNQGNSRDSSDEFLQYILSWAGQKGSSILIPPRKIIHHHLRLKSKNIDSIHYFALIILPLMLLSLGIWVFWRRRK